MPISRQFLPSARESGMWLRLDDGAVKNLASRKSVPSCGIKITSCIIGIVPNIGTGDSLQNYFNVSSILTDVSIYFLKTRNCKQYLILGLSSWRFKT